MTRPVVRTAVLALLVCALAGACAQPGQLGYVGDDATQAPATGAPQTPGAPPAGGDPAGPPAPDAPAGPPPPPGARPSPVADAGPDTRGRLDARVEITAPGPSEFLVRTETLAPGQSTGWITHPGTVISVVRSGTVTVTQRGACTPAPSGPEQSFFVADAVPYEMRNDGAEPAVLTRSELLAPGAEERRRADPAC